MPDNEYDALVQSFVAGDVRKSMAVSVDKQPDAEARIQNLARQYDLPIDAVRLNRPEVESRYKLDQFNYDELARMFPASSRVLSDPNAAAIAHDDVDNMTGLEAAVRSIGNAAKYVFGHPDAKTTLGGDLVAGVHDFNKGAWGVARAGAEFVAPAADWLTTGGEANNPLRNAGAYFGQLAQQQGAAGDALSPPDDSIMGGGVSSGVRSFASNALLMPLAFAPGGAPAILPIMAGITGGQAYQDAREKNLPMATALPFAASQAAIEYATEVMPVKWLIRDLKAGSPAWKMVTHQLATEIPGEQVATVLQDLNEWAILHPEKPFSSYLEQRPSAAAQTLIATLVGAGANVALVRGMDRIATSAQESEARAQRAEFTANYIAQFNQLASASKVLQRDGDTFEALIKQAASDGPVQDVSISADVLMQLGVGEKLAQVSSSVAEQLPSAAVDGGIITIPLEEYAAKIAPTEFAQSLVDHIKTNPNDFSRAEAREFLETKGEEMLMQVDRMLKQQIGDDAFRASADFVRDEMLKQLEATGRWSPDVNGLYASLVAQRYAVAAAQLGTTPEELFSRRPYKVTAQPITGPVFDQAAKKFDGTLAEMVDSLRSQPADNAKFVEITASASIDFVKQIAAATGLDTQGAKVVAVGSFVKHIMRRHPILTEQDWNALPAFFDGFNQAVLTKDRHGAQGPRIALSKDLGNGQSYGAVLELHQKKRMGRRLNLVTFFKGNTNSVNSWIENGAAQESEPGFSAAGGDPSLPNNPASAEPDRTIPDSEASSLPPDDTLQQGARGTYSPSTWTTTLLKRADLSTFLHETGHFFLEFQFQLAGELMKEAEAFGVDALPEGEQQIIRDAQAILDWFGVKSLAEWTSLEFEERRSYHEKFARGFEAYLFEGKAPSIELQGAFQRFRAWLVSIYKDMKNLGVELSDDVRQVFDRMIASTEQIQLAEQARSMMPLFTAQDAANGIIDNFAGYHALGIQAASDAIQDLQARTLRDLQWIRNARSREIAKLQKEHEGNRRELAMEIRREVMSRPVYRAWQFLTSRITNEQSAVPDQGRDATTGAAEDTETLGAGRLDLGELRLMNLPAPTLELLKARRMTAADGLHPDFVAEKFDFSSGDALIKALTEALPPGEEVDALTDQAMLERYGDLTTADGIAAAADRAIHNEARARLVATELAALDKAMSVKQDAGTDRNGRKRSINLLPGAAKEFANALIARLKIRDIRPSQYAAAEARATREAQKAHRAGDTAKAIIEKRNQLIQLYATKAAYAAQDSVDSGVRYVRKFDSEGVRKNIDPDYLDQIDAIRERFDFRTGQSLRAIDKRTSLAAWIESQREQGKEPVIPPDVANEAVRTSYKNLTLEEFNGLVDSIRQIEHLGRLKDDLLTAASQRSYEAARDRIVASIKDNAGNRVADTRTPTTKSRRAIASLKRFGALHIKAATWARIMDGGIEGPVWEYLIRPTNERADMETTMRAQATAALTRIMAPVFAQGRMGGAGVAFPSLGPDERGRVRSLNREARIALALNTGNAGNLQRLLDGEGWKVEQIRPVLESLTSDEWKAVQEIWDYFESYRPLIAAKERRVYGKEPDWVEPQPFRVATADGQTVDMRGGYYPIKYDPSANLRAEEHANAESARRQLQGAYTSATTRRSFTKSRSEEVVGRPLLYTLSGLYSGINDVIHDLAWHEWLIDANRLMRSKSVDQAIRTHYGPQVRNELKKWIDDIAEGERGADNRGEEALAWLRQGVSAAGLGFNAMSAAMQVLGFTQSLVRVGATWLGRGVMQYLGNPVAATKDVNGKSEFMMNRARTRFRELNELRNKVQDESPAMGMLKSGTFYLMMRAQQLVDVPTWIAGYEKAIANGHDERAAIARADQAVIDSQGGGQLKDLSGIERGGPALKLFTVFYSFMNTALNLGVAQTMTANTPAKRAKLIADYLLLYTVPPVLGAILKQALTPSGDGDDEWDLETLAPKLVAEQLSYMMGLMVIAREFGEAAKIVAGAEGVRDYSGPAGVRGIVDLYKFGVQAYQGDLDDAFRKSAINLIGDFSGLPAAQTNRTITGAQAIADEQTSNPFALVFGFNQKH